MPITIGDTTITSSANINLSLTGGNYANVTTSGIVVDSGIGLGSYSFNNGPLGGFRNKIINGKMTVAQRGSSFAAGGYTLDNWVNNYSHQGAHTVSQSTDVPSNNEFLYSLRSTVNTADASVGITDYAGFTCPIEGYNIRELVGNTFTLSFWVRSSKTGTHSVSIRNIAGDRSYIMTYTINTANTWEYKSITLNEGLITAGTWNYTNVASLVLFFSYMTGSTYQTASPNTWLTGNFLAATGQVNVMDTIGNIFAITGVQLEPGPVATPFEHIPHGIEFRRCQRYFQEVGTSGLNEFIYYQYSNYYPTAFYVPYSFAVPMRVAPVAGIVGTWNFANLLAQPNGFSISASWNAFRINVAPNALNVVLLAQNSGSGSKITFTADLL